jgi:hypothetical protein
MIAETIKRIKEKEMSKKFKKHSLGTLRPAVRTKDRSPNLIGPVAIQRADHIEIHRIFQETGGEEVICNLAGWFYLDSQGRKCITVQLSPPYGKRPVVATTIENFFEDDDEDDDLTS